MDFVINGADALVAGLLVAVLLTLIKLSSRMGRLESQVEGLAIRIGDLEASVERGFSRVEGDVETLKDRVLKLEMKGERQGGGVGMFVERVHRNPRTTQGEDIPTLEHAGEE